MLKSKNVYPVYPNPKKPIVKNNSTKKYLDNYYDKKVLDKLFT